LTDGNLASHAKRLKGAGLVEVNKSFREGKPVTSFKLTSEGRKALESHVRRLMSALSQRRVMPSPEAVGTVAELVEETPVLVEVAAEAARIEEEWVD
jgi:DNA-binding PadR family transcriptional regulator